MSAEDFYSELPSCQDFKSDNIRNDFIPVPQDWFVLTADIVRSRDAINAGRYKHVNMVGAAVIAAVLNKVDRDRVPFVFGGDGAVVVVPEADRKLAEAAIAGVVALARDVVDLELRAASIPVADIRKRGGDIKVRKYCLSPGNHLAMIIGDGLLIADRILKDPEAVKAYALAASSDDPVLSGLSCRWEPLDAQNGHIVSVILKPATDESLPEIIEGLAGGLGFNPLTDDEKLRLAEEPRLKFRFPPRTLSLEASFGSPGRWLKGYLMGIVESLFFMYGYYTGRRAGPFEPKKYIKELSLNTDHRKLGDSLQLVLDLTPDQLSALKTYLESQSEAGQLIYGLHVSDSALMTCFVQDVSNNQHIHFVDGANGGLSLAAIDFKKRLSDRVAASQITN
ncbi:DUF3095 family protein [Labrenzia sp. R4_2]|uniref:DUF3095 family protein n=1 Tax=Labrenzia sp. R4_2 TaxID=2821107 RepID=UPI001ADB4D09|nr:DUF3095 family protein [Labrenzia sp. R4_2]MBO9417924.1 DUF3095 family protein [Labrenzia sp. R4_2]